MFCAKLCALCLLQGKMVVANVKSPGFVPGLYIKTGWPSLIFSVYACRAFSLYIILLLFTYYFTVTVIDLASAAP